MHAEAIPQKTPPLKRESKHLVGDRLRQVHLLAEASVGLAPFGTPVCFRPAALLSYLLKGRASKAAHKPAQQPIGPLRRMPFSAQQQDLPHIVRSLVTTCSFSALLLSHLLPQASAPIHLREPDKNFRVRAVRHGC